ncbi:MAG: type II toxin-antitoxin system RelE/ParE family toxin [Acidobacteriota bacterium]
MIQTLADEGTYDIYVGIDSKVARRTLPKLLWPVARRKLHWIDAAGSVDALRMPPGNRQEALKADRSGTYSIRINDQYRMTFRFEGGNAYEVGIEDYH